MVEQDLNPPQDGGDGDDTMRGSGKEVTQSLNSLPLTRHWPEHRHVAPLAAGEPKKCRLAIAIGLS